MARRSGGRGGPFLSERVREISQMLVVAGLALAVLAGLAVLPARTWLSQREDMAAARDDLERIEVEVAELSRRLDQLQTNAEIERLAREHFDLVYPGEESYRIVPPDGAGESVDE
jgi:cell division protein FtsB